MSWQELPVISCPHCEQDTQIEEYYNLRPGSDVECGRCGKIIYIIAVETQVYADIRTAPDESA